MEVVGTMFGEAIETRWCPINSTSTMYVGALVYADANSGDGVELAGAAAGIADTTTNRVLLGVVIGTNNDTPVYSATSQSDTIDGVITQAAQVARNNYGHEGPYAIGDKQAMVKIAMITEYTWLKVPLYNSTIGTAPTVQTVTTGSTTGLGYTANACDFTPVADVCVAYCRTGANAGSYRITDDTSTTVATNDRAFAYDIAVGDTFVRAPMRDVGLSYVQTDANGLFFDVSASPATNYWIVDVKTLDLSQAGREHAIVRFTGDHFNFVRA